MTFSNFIYLKKKFIVQVIFMTFLNFRYFKKNIDSTNYFNDILNFKCKLFVIIEVM